MAAFEADAFVEQARRVSDANDLFDLFRCALSAYGVDRVLYGNMRDATQAPDVSPGLFSTYPEDWLHYYFEHDYLKKDPVCLHALQSSRAFTWDSVRRTSQLNDQQTLILDQAREAGLLDGVSMAFYGPGGQVHGIGLASSKQNPDIGLFLNEIETLATQFHLNMMSFAAPHTPPPPTLSPRESEVLKWVAEGKSNWAIGEILNISEHGVDFHMRNILRKLDADTRISAVVKAIHCGLIFPVAR